MVRILRRSSSDPVRIGITQVDFIAGVSIAQWVIAGIGARFVGLIKREWLALLDSVITARLRRDSAKVAAFAVGAGALVAGGSRRRRGFGRHAGIPAPSCRLGISSGRWRTVDGWLARATQTCLGVWPETWRARRRERRRLRSDFEAERLVLGIRLSSERPRHPNCLARLFHSVGSSTAVAAVFFAYDKRHLVPGGIRRYRLTPLGLRPSSGTPRLARCESTAGSSSPNEITFAAGVCHGRVPR